METTASYRGEVLKIGVSPATWPRFEKLNGRDPLALIVSTNLNRRNMTKGQQAMALAMIYPEPERGGRGKKKERVEETSTLFSAKRVQQARSVLRYSRELAESVIKVAISFDEALAKVEEARVQASSAEAKLTALRNEAQNPQQKTLFLET